MMLEQGRSEPTSVVQVQLELRGWGPRAPAAAALGRREPCALMPPLTEPAPAAMASPSSLQCQQPQTVLVCPGLGEWPLAAASMDGMWWSDPAGRSWLPCGDTHWVAGLGAAASLCSGVGAVSALRGVWPWPGGLQPRLALMLCCCWSCAGLHMLVL